MRAIARLSWIVALYLLTSIHASLCQPIQVPENPAPTTANLTHANPLDTFQFQLTLVIMGFGILVILAQMLMLRRVQILTANDIARNCAITIVTIAALILVIAGYSSAQIAPAFGLFGTIVGYLLGQSSQRPVAPSVTAEVDHTSAETGR
jgi:hypothetical protein